MENVIEEIMMKTNLSYIEAKTLATSIIDVVTNKLTPHFAKLSEHTSDSANKRRVIMTKARLKEMIGD